MEELVLITLLNGKKQKKHQQRMRNAVGERAR
jgi:hypothetical protein